MEQRSLAGGRYALGPELVSGAGDSVVEAVDTRTGQQVAVRVVLPQDAADQATLRELRQRAPVLTALRHPNICRVYDILQEGDSFYIVMEQPQGQTLDERLQFGHPQPDWLGPVARQVAAALAYAHHRGVFHFLLTPSAISLLPDGTVKVRDFGVAVSLHRQTTIDALQRTGGAAPLYLAPEQIEGRPVDERTDIFSLGAILYLLATGSPPFSGRDALSVAYRILHATPPLPRQLNPELPEEWQPVILRALEKEPAQRYQSAADLERSLPGQRAPSPDSTISSPKTSSPPDPPRTPRGDEAQTQPMVGFMAAVLEQGRLKEAGGDLTGALADYRSALAEAGPAQRVDIQRQVDRLEHLQSARARHGRLWRIGAAVTLGIVVANGALAYEVLTRAHTASTAQLRPSPSPRPPTVGPRSTPGLVLPQPGVRLYGPATGALPARVTSMGYRKAGIRARDFVAEAVFHNPYDSRRAGWDYGFLFRDTGPDQQYRLLLTSGQDYFLYLRSQRNHRETEALAGNGTAPSLDVSAGGWNRVRLVVRGKIGYLLVNGHRVATLNVAQKMLPGDVTAASSVLNGDGLNGAVTRYDSFTVWSVRG